MYECARLSLSLQRNDVNQGSGGSRDRKEITRWTERENYKLCGQRQETFADVDGSVGNSPMSRDSFFGNFADHPPPQREEQRESNLSICFLP